MAPGPDLTALSVRGVSRRFGGLVAVDNASLDVAPGVVQAIIGPNGAGKTTLFNLISGLYRPTQGEVRLLGEDVTGLPPSALARRGLSRTFQNLQIFFNMTAVENVMVGAHLRSDARLWSAIFRPGARARQEREAIRDARRLMEEVGLGAYLDADAAAMPYGALKRLEIARALASRPKLLLLDEPAAGLTPPEARSIGTLMRRIAADGVTIVLVEHNMRLVMGVSDRIVVLDRGRVLADGRADEIRANSDVARVYLGKRMRTARAVVHA
ncbi:MAG: ABC transporter ATP-binding protein [Alphaproteobacteria bacterium]|nr:ABC transporter ATP-binding protein [Alphaproteobacteria bacterium]